MRIIERATPSQASLSEFFDNTHRNPKTHLAFNYLGFSPQLIRAAIASTERSKKDGRMLMSESRRQNKQHDIAAMNKVLCAVGARIESGKKIERIDEIFKNYLPGSEPHTSFYTFKDQLDFVALQFVKSPGLIVTTEGAICGALLATENPKLMIAVVLQPSFYNYPLVSTIQFALIFKNR